MAKQYGKDYWDGDRKYGYGGYKYDGRWKPIAQAMIKHYGLRDTDNIIDIGCGKGHLLSEFKHILINGFYRGIEPSCYARNDSIPKCDIGNYTAQYTGVQKTNFYDFAYSINVLHNLNYIALKQAIREMIRVSKDRQYICVESYRNEEELCNLQCWALTCQSFYSPDDWKNILQDNGYRGDVGFVYFT